MSSLFEFVARVRQTASPPETPKAANTLKFGLLGAATIALTALIKPAKSHPEVVIQAIAARDKQRAVAYAKKHGIPHVKDSYEALLDDPSIDAVYIPLPASSHYEWALKAISKGKHVLLEKPAVVNAVEAERLFWSPLLQEPNAPILLEAMHFRFQPVWQHFLSLVDRTNINLVTAVAKLPSHMIPSDGNKFEYDMGGGNMLDLGSYPMYAVRQVMDAEPEECTKCTVRLSPAPRELCDEAADARFLFSGGRIGQITTDLQASVTTIPTFNIKVSHKEVTVEDKSLPDGRNKTCVRNIVLNNFLVAAVWHRIDIEDEFIIREKEGGRVVRRWSEKQSKKIYTFNDAGIDQPGEPFWTSYRHQLEQFVNKIRGREGSGLWVSNEDSIAQAKMIDMAYERSGLPLRPTSKFH
ncbi:unnamed protein product [Periconia digitata]|uniref:D-xylose 1-dehydrogenase (NADP(+), D-xylono-1,5-lactone-forming) n=1 Tax=Periconia digitata TaxID=1303443 RepID=A0A9W4UUU3_9PLEO|nr:unnamed protein product [Periconia digitata]